MTKDRIVFFASGDFAIDTFEMLVKNGSNIVGLVTSLDSVKFHKNTIKEVAERLRIPYYVVKNGDMEKDTFFIDWLTRMKADIFCVISFKKLPKGIIKLANKCAFNVHASLLPFLRGAAPINWAIRLGYKETGLTAFVLSDQIDCGDIIANTKVKIATGEQYTTLYKKLSDECIDFTNFVIEEVLSRENWKQFLIKQPSYNPEFEYTIHAHKVNHDYFNCHWVSFSAERFKRLLDSVNDIGVACYIKARDKDNNIHEFPAKIHEVELIEDCEDYCVQKTESDGKTFIRINFNDMSSLLIKKIQIVGKKVMDVGDFLNGFRYFRDENYITWIEDIMERNEKK